MGELNPKTQPINKTKTKSNSTNQKEYPRFEPKKQKHYLVHRSYMHQKLINPGTRRVKESKRETQSVINVTIGNGKYW